MARTGTAMPTTPAELADLLSNPQDAARVLGSTPEKMREFRSEYGKRLLADGSINAQLQEQVQLGIGEFMRSNGYSGRPPAGLAPPGRSAVKAAKYNPGAPGAKVDSEWTGGAAEIFGAIAANATNRLDPSMAAKMGRVQQIQNSFGSEVPADGGFLIPEMLRSDILQMSLEKSIVRPRAQVIPMDSLRVPIPMIDDTSHASSVLGGVTFYWTEEAASITESQASFGRVVLDAKKLSGYFSVPNELLSDAPAFGAFFDRVVPAGHAWFEDLAFMTGTGAGEPLGFVNCPASVQVTKESGQSAATILWENVTKMYARMLPASLNDAVWICNIDCFPQLATMALSVGTGGSAVWIGGYGAGGVTGAATPPMTILGRPVYFTEKLPALGTTGDICFADLGFYLLGDRQVLQAAVSPHYSFQQDKTDFRLLSRVDGRPWLQSALTPNADSTNTLSAFVQLATRS